jgi:hypothetical protein
MVTSVAISADGVRVLTGSIDGTARLWDREIPHGFLTYALLVEGLGEAKADLAPNDGRIRLGEWLEYGRARVPGLVEEVAAGTRRARGLELPEPGAALDRTALVQRPEYIDLSQGTGDALLSGSD